MPIIILFGMNFVVLASSFLITYRIFRLPNFVDSLICWFVFYFLQIVCVELLLGILGILTLNNVVLSMLAILSAVWVATRKKKYSFNLTQVLDKFKGLLANYVVLFIVSAILGFTIIKIFESLFVYPPLGWDSFTYHFVFPVEWLKHGNLVMPSYIGDDQSTPYYPIAGSLYFLWLMLPVKNVLLAGLGQLPFYFLSFLAVYSISRKVGLNKEMAFYGAGLLLVTPNFFKEMHIGLVDIMVAAMFLASVNFLLALYKSFNWRGLILWGLSFGLFVGVKNLGIVYGVFPFLFFIYVLYVNFKKIGLRGIIVSFMTAVFLMAVAGGYAYIRNLVLFQNPLFPAEVQVLGIKVFKGAIPFSSYRAAWMPGAFSAYKMLFAEGLGAQFILIVLPALLLAIYALMKKFKGKVDAAVVFVLALPVVLYLSFLYILPFHFVKYLYPFLGMSYVAAFYVIAAVNIPLTVVSSLAAICTFASLFELNRHQGLFFSMMLSILLFFLLPRVMRWRFKARFLAVLLGVCIVALSYANASYDQDEFVRYMKKSRFEIELRSAWQWLNNNTDHARIAYAGRGDALPLYGTHFKNDPLYVSVNSVHPAKLHFFPNSRYVLSSDCLEMHHNTSKPGNYRENPDYAIWLQNLKSEKIDFLFIYSLHTEDHPELPPVFPVEDSWAAQHSEVFQLAYSNNLVHIYKLR